jgi:ATP-dependent protease ClpP protease subunit
MEMNAPNQPQGPIDYILGYNLLVDRFGIMRLMNAISEATTRGAKSITLCISSPGGDPAQAFYAHEILKNYPVPIHTHNIGSVHSAAMPIFLAGSHRFAVPYATFLMHKTVHTPAAGTSYGIDHLDYSGSAVQADDERSIIIIAERTKQTVETVRPWMLGQQLRSTEFALQHGFIEKVVPVQFPAQSKFFQIAVG